jgi:hypothetical protein
MDRDYEYADSAGKSMTGDGFRLHIQDAIPYIPGTENEQESFLTLNP